MNVCAQDDVSEDGGVYKDGRLFNISPDRKMINVGGVNTPEGLYIYMNRWFERFEGEIKDLGRKIDDLSNEIKELKKSVEKNAESSQVRTSTEGNVFKR